MISLSAPLCSGQDYFMQEPFNQYLDTNNVINNNIDAMDPLIYQVPPTSPPVSPPTTQPLSPPTGPPTTCEAEDYLCETIKLCWPCRPQPGQTPAPTILPLCRNCQALFMAQDETAIKKAACTLCKALPPQSPFIPSYCALPDVRNLC